MEINNRSVDLYASRSDQLSEEGAFNADRFPGDIRLIGASTRSLSGKGEDQQAIGFDSRASTKSKNSNLNKLPDDFLRLGSSFTSLKSILSISDCEDGGYQSDFDSFSDSGSGFDYNDEQVGDPNEALNFEPKACDRRSAGCRSEPDHIPMPDYDPDPDYDPTPDINGATPKCVREPNKKDRSAAAIAERARRYLSARNLAAGMGDIYQIARYLGEVRGATELEKTKNDPTGLNSRNYAIAETLEINGLLRGIFNMLVGVRSAIKQIDGLAQVNTDKFSCDPNDAEAYERLKLFEQLKTEFGEVERKLEKAYRRADAILNIPLPDPGKKAANARKVPWDKDKKLQGFLITKLEAHCSIADKLIYDLSDGKKRIIDLPEIDAVKLAVQQEFTQLTSEPLVQALFTRVPYFEGAFMSVPQIPYDIAIGFAMNSPAALRPVQEMADGVNDESSPPKQARPSADAVNPLPFDSGNDVDNRVPIPVADTARSVATETKRRKVESRSTQTPSAPPKRGSPGDDNLPDPNAAKRLRGKTEAPEVEARPGKDKYKDAVIAPLPEMSVPLIARVVSETIPFGIHESEWVGQSATTARIVSRSVAFEIPFNEQVVLKPTPLFAKLITVPSVIRYGKRSHLSSTPHLAELKTGGSAIPTGEATDRVIPPVAINPKGRKRPFDNLFPVVLTQGFHTSTASNFTAGHGIRHPLVELSSNRTALVQASEQSSG